MIKTTDIRSRQFRKILRGYDPVEVKYFLEMLADEFGQMEEKLEKLEALVAEFDQTRKGRDKILKEAQDRAARIILDAESISSGVVKSAEQKKRAIQESSVRLNYERDKLIQDLRNCLKNQADLIALLENTDDWSQTEDVNDEK